LGRIVTESEELEDGVKSLLAQPSPALPHVTVNPMKQVMPPHADLGAAHGMVLHSRAALHERVGDVWEMVKEDFLSPSAVRRPAEAKAGTVKSNIWHERSIEGWWRR
jgi:hypothetical protein